MKPLSLSSIYRAMDIFPIIAVTLFAVIMAAMLKKNNIEYGLILSLMSVILILLFVLEKTLPFIEEIQALINSDITGLEVLPILLKVVGITIISQMTSTICKDSGQSALAYSVDIAARVSILILCLPVFTNILNFIHEILS